MKIISTPCTIGLLSIILAGAVQAQVLFTENFNSYANGSNLSGQGGWEVVNTGGNNTVRLSTSAGTLLNNGSIVADGQETSIGSISFARHALPGALSTSDITTLTFDAYASSGSPHTTNTAGGFAKMSVAVVNDLYGYWTASSTGDLWYFSATTVSNQSAAVSFSGGYDKVIHLGVVIDGPAGQIYGIYDFGSGYLSTPTYNITPATITSLDAISFDFQYGFGGGELDNFSVQAVPEPSTYAVLFGLAALLGAGVKKWRHRPV